MRRIIILMLFSCVIANIYLLSSANAAIIPGGSTLLQVTQNTTMNKTVSVQSNSDPLDTEFNAQLPLTKSRIIHVIEDGFGGYEDVDDEYSNLFDTYYTWESTINYNTIPRRTLEYSPHTNAVFNATMSLEFNYVNLTHQFIYQIMLSKSPRQMALYAGGSKVFDCINEGDDIIVLQTGLSSVYYRLLADTSRDSHILTLKFSATAGNVIWDNSSFNFGVDTGLPYVLGGLVGDNGSVFTLVTKVFDTTVFAIDSNYVINFPNPISNNTDLAPMCIDFFLNRMLGESVTQSSNAFLLQTPSSVGSTIRFSRTLVYNTPTKKVFTPTIIPDFPYPAAVSFTMNYAPYNINLNNCTIAIALHFPTPLETFHYFDAAYLGTTFLIQYDNINPYVWMRVLNLSFYFDLDSCINQLDAFYFIIEVVNAKMYFGFFIRGMQIMINVPNALFAYYLGLLSGDTYFNINADDHGIGFAGFTATTATELPNYFSGISGNTTDVYGYSQINAPKGCIASYNRLTATAEVEQVIPIPTPTALGSYVFDASNIDLRRVQAALDYASVVPSNLSVYNDVRLRLDVQFFAGITLERIWFGTDSGTLTYDSGQISVSQRQNGIDSQGVRVKLFVQQVATFDTNNIDAYDVATTSGEAHVVIKYNIYGVLASSLYSASWMFNLALTMLAPLAVIVLFPIIVHGVWKRQIAYPTGLLFSGIVLLFTTLVSTIISVMVCGLALMIMYFLARNESGSISTGGNE